MNFTTNSFDPPYQVRLIAVEGNIAAGKSTLLEQLTREPARLASLLFARTDAAAESTEFDYARVVPEPLGKWTSVGAEGTDLLGAMYADPVANGMACQMNIVNTQLDAIVDVLREVVMTASIAECVAERDTDDSRVVPLGPPRCAPMPCKPTRILLVTERSTLSGKHVFARALLDKGKMPPAHWAVYCHSFDAAHALFREQVSKLFPRDVDLRVLGTVLLQVTPEQALRRAERRGRDAERGLPLELYEDLDRRHREVFALRGNKLVAHEIVAVDASTLTGVLRGKVKESVLQLALAARKKAAPPPPPSAVVEVKN